MKKHLVFIVNPKSGVDRKKEISDGVAQYLDHRQYSHEIIFTEYFRHGTLLAQEAAAKGAYSVVAVGGDGSINDIVRGLQGTDTLLSIIPKGSGNGMARTMNIPLTVPEALAVINKGNTVAIDMAYADEQLYISNAGVAFDALISKKFAKSEKRGIWVYSWLVTKYMWLYKNRKFEITIDGTSIAQEAFIVNVANGRQFGYNFKIAPDASFTDGWLDVIIIRRFPKMLAGLLVLRLMNGSITRSRYVQHFRAKEITVSHPDLKLIQTDGDAHACGNKVTFSIRPAAQSVIVP